MKIKTTKQIKLLMDAVKDNWHVMSCEQKMKDIFDCFDMLFTHINKEIGEIDKKFKISVNKIKDSNLTLSGKLGRLKHKVDCIEHKLEKEQPTPQDGD